MNRRQRFFSKRIFIRGWWAVSVTWCLVAIVLIIIPMDSANENATNWLKAIALVVAPPFVLLLLGQVVQIGRALLWMARDSRK